MDYKIRLIEETDADFIVKLRNNPKLNRYLNPTSSNIEDQIRWIKDYKIKEKKQEEFYFIILENGYKKGLYRLYKISSISFTIGSWLFDVCENKHLPIITDLLMADMGFYKLNKEVLLFDVRKENKKVLHYHALKKPLFYSEDESNNYYLLTKKQWEESKNNVLSFFGIDAIIYKKIKALYEF